jgi:tetratricopeptide (TPR) repeat protein
MAATADEEGATELLEGILESRLRANKQDPSKIVNTMSVLSTVWKARGNADQALVQTRQAFAYSESSFGIESETTLIMKANLAAALHNSGLMEESRQMAEEVLEARGGLSGEKDPNTFNTMLTLAATLEMLGELEEAREMLQLLAPLMFRLLGERDPSTLTTLNALGVNLLKSKLYSQALDVLEVSSALSSRLHGSEDYRTLREKLHLSIALMQHGKPAAARELLEEVADIRTRTLGAEHPDTIEVGKLIKRVGSDSVS